MANDRNESSGQRDIAQSQDAENTHPAKNPFNEPAKDLPVSPEEDAQAEQQRKDAMSERD